MRLSETKEGECVPSPLVFALPLYAEKGYTLRLGKEQYAPTANAFLGA